jgi:hypothetical protein
VHAFKSLLLENTGLAAVGPDLLRGTPTSPSLSVAFRGTTARRSRISTRGDNAFRGPTGEMRIKQ